MPIWMGGGEKCIAATTTSCRVVDSYHVTERVFFSLSESVHTRSGPKQQTQRSSQSSRAVLAASTRAKCSLVPSAPSFQANW
jgi:hypothetical protein